MPDTVLPCCYPLLEPNTQNDVRAILKMTNWIREIHGVGPVRLSQKLMHSARSKALEMHWLNYFGHVNPKGEGPPRGVDENIGRGHFSALEVTEAWRKSQGHHDNIISPMHRYMGVGLMLEPNKLWGPKHSRFWVQHFQD